MANSFNIPPILQEFDQFITTCKKLNADLQKAGTRLTELEAELAKEKAERRNLHNNSHRKIQELTAQNESIRSDLQKSLKSHQDESNQIRSMLVAAQNEHKSVLKIIQDELDRTKQALRSENQGRTEVTAELQRLKTEHNALHGSRNQDLESLKRLSAQLKSAHDEIERLKTSLKKTQEDYARAIESAGRAEETLRNREEEFRKKLHSAEATAKAESDSKQWINSMYIKIQKEYEQLGKQLQQEQENVKRMKMDLSARHQEYQNAMKTVGGRSAKESHDLQQTEKALRSRDDEVLRLQEQLIKTKRNLQDTDEARKSAQAIANQLRSELESARNEVERLRTEHPLRALLMNKEIEINEISNQLSELPDDHPDRADLTALLDSSMQQRAYFEQLLTDAEPQHANASSAARSHHIY